MSNTVEGVESERESDDALSRDLEPFRNTLHEFDDVGGVERKASHRGREVCDEEAVQAWKEARGLLRCRLQYYRLVL